MATIAEIPKTVEKAAEFEHANRAHGSVKDQEFYSVSKCSVDEKPGALLKVEEVTDTNLYTLAPGLAMSRFVYQSQTSRGVNVPVSGYILWPYVAAPSKSGIPVVAFAHGTCGISADCAPSNMRSLWHQFAVPFPLAQAGYAVVATDYAGLGVGKDGHGKPIVHEYLTRDAHAHDILFSVSAARAAFPELSKEFVLAGTFQGGLGVWGAAQILLERTMDGYLGTVSFNPVPKVIGLNDDLSWMAPIIVNLVPTLEKNFPAFDRHDILTPEGVDTLEKYLTLQGANGVLFNLPFQNALKPDWAENEHVLKYQAENRTGRQSFAGPLLVLQGAADYVIADHLVLEVVKDTAAMFREESIEYHLHPHVTHAPIMHTASSTYMKWIADRFEGKRSSPGLNIHEAKPIRPGHAYCRDRNWNLKLKEMPHEVD